jgi:hypothetical protein
MMMISLNDLGTGGLVLDSEVSEDTTEIPMPKLSVAKFGYDTRSRRELERYLEEKALARELESLALCEEPQP